MTIWSQLGLGLVTGLAIGCSASSLEVGPGEVDGDGGKTDGVAGGAELKVALDPGQVHRALSELSLRDDDAQRREIWFYDTFGLDLFDNGTILRARNIEGDDDDVTVKLRPFTEEQLAARFLAADGLKCEIDRTTSGATPSCSIKSDSDGDLIDAVNAGALTIDALFTSMQEDLAAEYGPGVGWDALVALGPIPARVWTIRTDALPAKLTAELWDMPDASQLLELSLKVDADDADAAMADLLDFVGDHGLDLAAQQDGKTRSALEALVSVRQQ